MREIWLEVNATAFNGSSFSLQDILEEYTQSQSQFVYHLPENIFLIGFYIPVFLIALVSNVLVITIFIKYRSFRTITNCFLINLAVADLLVTIICMPAAVGQAIHSAWIFGPVLCKIHFYAQAVAVGSSVFTLTAMSIDRYLAIRHPLKRKNFISKRLIMKVICFIWLISMAIFFPILYVRKMDGFTIHTYNFVYCFEEWNNPESQKGFGVAIFVLVYALPGLIIASAYALMGCRLRQTHLLPDLTETITSTSTSYQICTLTQINMLKERRKVARTLMVLATVFAICWLPSSVLGLILDFASASSTKPGVAAATSTNFDFYLNMHRYCILLGHLNSLLNPLLYCLLTKNFRNHVKDCFQAVCNSTE